MTNRVRSRATRLTSRAALRRLLPLPRTAIAGRVAETFSSIYNVHEREIAADSEAVGAMLDSLGHRGDRLWPAWRWPAQRFDGSPVIGADGGHGPVCYFLSGYALAPIRQ